MGPDGQLELERARLIPLGRERLRRDEEPLAIRWLPQAPRQALPILALQVGAALAAMAPVFFLHL